MRYTLINGVARNKLYPNSFEIPPRDKVRSLRPGDIVKIGVEFKSDDKINGERFWVIITQVTPTGFVGKVNNDLIFTSEHGLQDESDVRFAQEHILAVY